MQSIFLPLLSTHKITHFLQKRKRKNDIQHNNKIHWKKIVNNK